MPLLIAAWFMAVLAANVAISVARGKVFLTDLQKMLVLMAASIFFVAVMPQKGKRATPQFGKWIFRSVTPRPGLVVPG